MQKQRPDSVRHTCNVAPGEQPMRLDAWLARAIGTLSRSRIQSLIEQGFASINGKIASKRTRVRPGMSIMLTEPPPEPTTLLPQNIPLTIIYEDNELIAVNKPAALVVHPAPGHPNQTLVNAILHHCPDLPGIGGEYRPGIVHRLDADTTGVIVVAKTAQAMASLAAQFSQRTPSKQYIAICHGIPHPGRGTVETEIGRNPHDRKRMTATPRRGRHAITHYTLQASLKHNMALMKVNIETGRTHQIRVHLNHIKHPIVGDPVYGSRKRDNAIPGCPQRQMLHASRLKITHPVGGESMRLQAPLPTDMKNLIQKNTL